MAKDHAVNTNFDVVIHAENVPSGQHAGRYNAPAASEIAAVVCGLEHGKRDIVLHHKQHGLKRIAETNRAYDAMQYPLLYTTG